MRLFPGRERGQKGGPYNSLYGEAPPERGTFFRRQVYERVGISVVEVHERVGKSVISVVKKPSKKQMHFMAVKKSKKCSCFVINFIHYSKNSAFTEIKGIQSLNLGAGPTHINLC